MSGTRFMIRYDSMGTVEHGVRKLDNSGMHRVLFCIEVLHPMQVSTTSFVADVP